MGKNPKKMRKGQNNEDDSPAPDAMDADTEEAPEEEDVAEVEQNKTQPKSMNMMKRKRIKCSKRQTPIGQRNSKTIPSPDSDAEPGDLYFQFTPRFSKYASDASGHTSCTSSSSSMTHDPSCPSDSTCASGLDDSINELILNKFDKPEFVLLKYWKEQKEYHRDTHLLKGIVGVQQLIPQHDTMIHCYAGSKFSVDAIADRNLQAQIKGCVPYKAMVGVLEDHLKDMTLDTTSGSWCAPNKDYPKLKGFTAEMDNYTKYIQKGFMSKMSNGHGKNSALKVYNLCRSSLVHGLGIGAYFCDSPYGVVAEKPVKFIYQEYLLGKINKGEIRHELTEKELAEGIQATVDWTKEVIVQEKSPDAAIFLTEGNVNNYDLYGIPIIFEIKSLNEAIRSLPKCLLQTWIQALPGLKNRDVSYGILYHPRAIYILELRKVNRGGQTHRATKTLVTSMRRFNLVAHDDEHFNTSEYIDFVFHLCCILAVTSGEL